MTCLCLTIAYIQHIIMVPPTLENWWRIEVMVSRVKIEACWRKANLRVDFIIQSKPLNHANGFIVDTDSPAVSAN